MKHKKILIASIIVAFVLLVIVLMINKPTDTNEQESSTVKRIEDYIEETEPRTIPVVEEMPDNEGWGDIKEMEDAE